tara:strand:- start:915 stop:1214 length:300 start_codon:yes stop_codon:yes gene_type:complete
MATVGISASIDVSKIDKTKLIKGEKGTYLNITAFVNLDEKDQYDNNGMITQSVTADEREAGTRGVILGNSRVFYTGESSKPESSSKKEVVVEEETDLPF